jgi:hypothetical protein
LSAISGPVASVTTPPSGALRPEQIALASFGTPLLIALGAAWSIVLALIWRFEEPAKAITVLVMLGAYTVAVALVFVSHRLGLIAQPRVWTGALIAKMTLSFVILAALWMRPLVGVDLVRTSTQIPGLLTDTNFYDYLAERVARGGFANSASLFFATWQSVGIVAYGALIYGTFGVSALYVSAFNVVFAHLAAIAPSMPTSAIAPGGSRVWRYGWLVLFLPVQAYYDSMLSKEPLTNAFFFLALLAAARIYSERGRTALNATVFVLAILLLTVLRPNAAMLALATPLALLIRGRHAMRRMIAAGAAAALAMGVASLVTDPMSMVANTVNLVKLGERTQELLQQKADAGDAGIKSGVGQLLSPRGSAIDLPLVPVRAVIWNYLPYPLLVPKTDVVVSGETMLWNDWNRYFKTWIEVARVSSVVLLILATPWFLVAFLRPARSVPGFAFLGWNFVVPLLVMSNLMFVMGSRYRSLIEPLFFAVAGWGFLYGRRAPRALVYGAFVIGILAYEAAITWR